MHMNAINSLDPIVKVLYNKDGALASFLTRRKHTLNDNAVYMLYSKRTHNYWGKHFTQEELNEISELMGSPIEKIDFEELEKF